MKKLLVLILVIAAAYLVWRAVRPVDRGELAFGRLWIDHLPRNDTDTVNIFAVLRDEPVGVFQAASGWRGQFELFRYEPRGDGKLAILYPQTRERERVAYRATECGEQGFDYCLVLDGNSRGLKRYYSQRGWEIGGGRALPEAAKALLPALAPAP
jgi:hypothetical protein